MARRVATTHTAIGANYVVNKKSRLVLNHLRLAPGTRWSIAEGSSSDGEQYRVCTHQFAQSGDAGPIE